MRAFQYKKLRLSLVYFSLKMSSFLCFRGDIKKHDTLRLRECWYNWSKQRNKMLLFPDWLVKHWLHNYVSLNRSFACLTSLYIDIEITANKSHALQLLVTYTSRLILFFGSHSYSADVRTYRQHFNEMIFEKFAKLKASLHGINLADLAINLEKYFTNGVWYCVPIRKLCIWSKTRSLIGIVVLYTW